MTPSQRLVRPDPRPISNGVSERPLLLTRLMAVVMLGFLALVAASVRTDTARAAVEGGLAFGVVAGLIVTIASVSMTPHDSHLDVRNFFVRYRIGWNTLFYVIDRSGLQLTLRFGARVLPLVFGSSLLASLTGNKRARLCALGLRQRMAAAERGQPELYETRFNWLLVVNLVVCVSLYLTLTLGLRVVRHQ